MQSVVPPILRVLVLCIGGIAAPSAPAAADAPWVRYENTSFIAYSNAPEKKAVALLTDLENFRAAFLQIASIKAPPGGTKTVVLITATKKEFQPLVPGKHVAGYAIRDGRTTLIIMPAQGDRKWTRTVIRHEFGHALLGYSRFQYPAWYEEGFAELVSSTELTKDGKSFTIGAPPARAKHNGPPIFGWDLLVSEEFDPHSLTDLESGSSAYAQAWLLAHYATLGNDLKNSRQLQAYFDRIQDGDNYTSAFEASFGVSVADLWESTLRPYARRIPNYTLPFQAGSLDPVFAPTAPAAGEVDAVMRYIALRKEAAKDRQRPTDILAALSGRWAPIRYGLACDDQLELALSPDRSFVALRAPAEQGGEPLPSLDYRHEVAADGTVRLEYSPEPGMEGASLYLRHQSPGLMCFGTGPLSTADCPVLLFRCED